MPEFLETVDENLVSLYINIADIVYVAPTSFPDGRFSVRLRDGLVLEDLAPAHGVYAPDTWPPEGQLRNMLDRVFRGLGGGSGPWPVTR